MEVAFHAETYHIALGIGLLLMVLSVGLFCSLRIRFSERRLWIALAILTVGTIPTCIGGTLRDNERERQNNAELIRTHWDIGRQDYDLGINSPHGYPNNGVCTQAWWGGWRERKREEAKKKLPAVTEEREAKTIPAPK